MKTIQIEAHTDDNNTLLRAGGVRRIHPGWYTVHYRGPVLDRSTVCAAKRNPKGEIKYN
jgi:hypothetical protein